MEQETILVVDDNKEIVYSISELLKYEGYQVMGAYDGMQALDVLEQNKIDLILLDVMMPRLNGLSTLMKLREKHKIPVIILSAKTEESDKVSGLIMGADDYVEKTVQPRGTDGTCKGTSPEIPGMGRRGAEGRCRQDCKRRAYP